MSGANTSLPDGTLSHFLNQAGGRDATVLSTAASTVSFRWRRKVWSAYYSKALRHQKVILHCNLLWMTSPKADLSAEKEEPFNHSRLVPQFFPRIPCYKADANERLSAFWWSVRSASSPGANICRMPISSEKSIPHWTLEDDGGSPPHYPNIYKNPLAQITFVVPSDPRLDPDRGPGSPRHKPWSSQAGEASRFDWVPLDSSLQWRAFRRVLRTLRARGNDVLVIVGPFNEHFMAEDNRPAYRKTRDGIEAWLAENHVPHVTPETLPSALYADDCHPLTEGYQLLARRLYENPTFQQWLRSQSTGRETHRQGSGAFQE